ncbi:MAG: NAD(P)H-binding protein [Flammeovirgaceae bacterium]|jgi:uncharacterized protein YbjT (DUF2867 family)|nr:NAD(P)H-binding protein [Flammeovirgaceae bacterium]|tara:strand:- start:11952 stop:12641 length:690 start_codon:yes stop_codon:yes gene_type:complete
MPNLKLKKSALVIGATGMVGKELVKQLQASNHYHTIIIVVRRQQPMEADSRIKFVQVEDFDHLATHAEDLRANHIYCCLGSTIKKAGSKKSFEKIDWKYPVKLAQLSQAYDGFESYLIITAMGANPLSAIFYNRVKGNCEKELMSMSLPRLKIFRPSLLLGVREEFRFGEKIGTYVIKFLTIIFKFFGKKMLLAIPGAVVATSMINIAQINAEGCDILEPDAIFKSAGL